MEELLKVIERVRGRIGKHRTELQKSEALTRYALVDPILRALGWDTTDPEQVRPEFPTETGKPDYALIGEGKPLIMVEAKSLGTNLEEARRKGFQYCFENKVRFYIVTDGAIWKVWYGTLARLAGKSWLELTFGMTLPAKPPANCSPSGDRLRRRSGPLPLRSSILESLNRLPWESPWLSW